MDIPRTASTATPRKILLVYPRVPDTYWSYRHALAFVGKQAVMPPLGLLTVAAIMGDQYAYRLIDINVSSLSEDDLSWADMVFVSAGFKMVFVGLETPVEASLESTGKRQNLRQSMTTAVHRMQRVGVEVTGGFIVGFDTDPPDIFDRQIAFIQELGIPTAMVGMLMALPGTRLWQRLSAEGRILSRSSGDNTHQEELNFQTLMDRDQLITGYRRILQQIYTPRRYFARSLALLRRLPRATGARRRRLRVGPREVTALFRSLTIQGHHFFVITGMMLRRQAQLPHGARVPDNRTMLATDSSLRSDSAVSL